MRGVGDLHPARLCSQAESPAWVKVALGETWKNQVWGNRVHGWGEAWADRSRGVLPGSEPMKPLSYHCLFGMDFLSRKLETIPCRV